MPTTVMTAGHGGCQGSIALNPVIRTRDWGSDFVEDSTGTTKKYHDDTQKIYDTIWDLCNATQTVIEQFIQQSQCQVALLVMKRAELVDLTMKNISEQKASMMTPQRMGELGKELGKATSELYRKTHEAGSNTGSLVGYLLFINHTTNV